MTNNITKELAEALELALSSHGTMLLSDPPQDAWKTRQVERIGRAALASYHSQAEEPSLISDAEIDRIALLTEKAMEDGLRGFMKTWGWQQFARTLIENLQPYGLRRGHAEWDGWMPIETAPKDMGSYLFRCNGVVLQGFRDATGALCVCLEAGASGHPQWRLMRRAPTHWRPLPAAPSLPSPNGEKQGAASSKPPVNPINKEPSNG